MLKYLIVCCLFYAACFKKNEWETLNWEYPSSLTRDTNLIGVWYSYTDEPNGTFLLNKFVYNADGSLDTYSFDTTYKKFNDRNEFANLSGKKQRYWSTKDSILTIYNLLVSTGTTNKPITHTLKYLLTTTKDTFYTGAVEFADIINRGNGKYVRKMRP